MNSFAGVERALEALRAEQITTLEAGGAVERATFSAATDVLRMTRTKEDSHDYRYFPEPDLPPIHVADEWMEAERMGLPELPAAKRRRFDEQYGLPETETRVLVGRRFLAD